MEGADGEHALHVAHGVEGVRLQDGPRADVGHPQGNGVQPQGPVRVGVEVRSRVDHGQQARGAVGRRPGHGVAALAGVGGVQAGPPGQLHSPAASAAAAESSLVQGQAPMQLDLGAACLNGRLCASNAEAMELADQARMLGNQIDTQICGVMST